MTTPAPEAQPKLTIQLLLERLQGQYKQLMALTLASPSKHVTKFRNRVLQFGLHLLNPMTDAWRWIREAKTVPIGSDVERASKLLVSTERASLIATYPLSISRFLHCQDLDRIRRSRWAVEHLDECKTLVAQIVLSWKRLIKASIWKILADNRSREESSEVREIVLEDLRICFNT